ncbi:GlsB/YeaQ/YmgE family stress response membrane protein [Ktedonospora formicarum]|uniref:GlsB/YeaQ/YmgE family stress response membrane protein n=1 Tax=Ktedonospora formicarum TaxID=2778364 RepID=A0A8J3I0X9_9CHLR|nr:GlsB/YeaQ/YmgE family stress response membrane protein [Ktedonospora formicarum]GHO44775.1 hypothetical protein KSX_29380 [Ktedonospora formicarum]
MLTFTTVVLGATLNAGGLIGWIVVGLIAGFLASLVMRGSGFGIIGDVVVGLVGALIGGFLSNLLLPGANFGIVGSIVVAFIGACILIAILHAVGPRRTRSTL